MAKQILFEKDVKLTELDVPIELLFGVDYKFSIYAANSSGIGKVSVLPFTTGFNYIPSQTVIISPYSGATLFREDKISWIKADNAAFYKVEIAQDPYFLKPVKVFDNYINTVLEIPKDIPDGIYYVRVASQNKLSSAPWSFFIEFNLRTIAENTSLPDDTLVSDLIKDFLDSTTSLAKRINFALSFKETLNKTSVLYKRVINYEEKNIPIYKGKKTYTVKVNSPNSHVLLKDGQYRKSGATVEFMAIADNGFFVKTIIISDSKKHYTVTRHEKTYSFIMPEGNVTIDVITDTTTNVYELKWENRICTGTPILYNLKWLNRICKVQKIPYELKWTDKTCNIQRIPYDLQWKDKVCITKTTSYILQWSSKVCVANITKGFGLEWKDRVCVVKTPSYILEWKDRVCIGRISYKPQ